MSDTVRVRLRGGSPEEEGEDNGGEDEAAPGEGAREKAPTAEGSGPRLLFGGDSTGAVLSSEGHTYTSFLARNPWLTRLSTSLCNCYAVGTGSTVDSLLYSRDQA